jgi:hypothetical protein
MFLEVLLFAFLALVVGLGLTFMGYAAFRVLLPIIGFFAGLWLGMDIVKDFSMNYPIMGVSLGLILGVILGGIFAAVAYFVYALAIILIGLSLGYALGAGLMLALGLPNGFLTFTVGIIGAVALGYLFWKGDMPKLYIMVITAFAGASALFAGVLALFGQIPPSQLGLAVVQPYIAQSWFWIVVWVVIGGVGLFTQMQTVKAAESMVPASYNYDATVKDYKEKAKKQSS